MSTNLPRVSVLMTVYNAGPFLSASIDSLIEQSYPDWELIAIENGSTDQSPYVLAEYPDPRIRVIRFPKNIGRTPALRRAFDESRGEYIAVLDADDLSRPERLARQVAFLDANPTVTMVGSWVHYIDQQAKVFAEFKPPSNEEELRDSLGWMNPIAHSSVMYRRQPALEAGGYPADLVYSQDLGLVLALAQQSRIAVIEEFLCQWRLLPTSMTRTSKYRAIIIRETLRNLGRAAETVSLSAKARRLNRRAQAIAEIKLGILTIRANCVLVGLNMVVHGLFRDPSALWANALLRRSFGFNTNFVRYYIEDAQSLSENHPTDRSLPTK